MKSSFWLCDEVQYTTSQNCIANDYSATFASVASAMSASNSCVHGELETTNGWSQVLTCKKGVTAMSYSIPFYLYRAVMHPPNCTLYERKLHCIYIIYKAMTK